MTQPTKTNGALPGVFPLVFASVVSNGVKNPFILSAIIRVNTVDTGYSETTQYRYQFWYISQTKSLDSLNTGSLEQLYNT